MAKGRYILDCNIYAKTYDTIDELLLSIDFKEFNIHNFDIWKIITVDGCYEKISSCKTEKNNLIFYEDPDGQVQITIEPKIQYMLKSINSKPTEAILDYPSFEMDFIHWTRNDKIVLYSNSLECSVDAYLQTGKITICDMTMDFEKKHTNDLNGGIDELRNICKVFEKFVFIYDLEKYRTNMIKKHYITLYDIDEYVKKFIYLFMSYHNIEHTDFEICYKEKTDYLTFTDFDNELREMIERHIERSLLSVEKYFKLDEFKNSIDDIIGTYYYDFNVKDAELGGDFLL